ncbi:uncharacterized protein CTRU02_208675 [Colletotrichum truncatum]|uniref:Uncharacterized protein n=1 Tax=Colletotrichum truncatum TaxID=5467 RepID=A0ACC3YWY2_COLTU
MQCMVPTQDAQRPPPFPVFRWLRVADTNALGTPHITTGKGPAMLVKDV